MTRPMARCNLRTFIIRFRSLSRCRLVSRLQNGDVWGLRSRWQILNESGVLFEVAERVTQRELAFGGGRMSMDFEPLHPWQASARLSSSLAPPLLSGTICSMECNCVAQKSGQTQYSQ